jgi:hypothetical protein
MAKGHNRALCCTCGNLRLVTDRRLGDKTEAWTKRTPCGGGA